MNSVTFASCFFFLIILTAVRGAPGGSRESNSSEESDRENSDCNRDNGDVYDQRQNGTENYRIHLNGVVVLVAPAETVLQVAQLANLENDSDSSSGGSENLKPKPRPPTPGDKSEDDNETDSESGSKSPNRNKEKNKEKRSKISNLLQMARNIKQGDFEGFYRKFNR